MEYLISKLKSLFKTKERKILVPPLSKDFFKKANIHMEELNASNIQAKELKSSKR